MLWKIREREFLFYCFSSEEETIAALRAYFHQTFQDNNKHQYFSGLFITERDFEIRAKWEMIFSSRPHKKPPYISGSLTAVEPGRTLIRLIARERSLIRTVHLLLFIFPCALIVYGYWKQGLGSIFIAGGLLLFLFIVVFTVILNPSEDNYIRLLAMQLKFKTKQGK
jgi:hypothetical protein